MPGQGHFGDSCKRRGMMKQPDGSLLQPNPSRVRQVLLTRTRLKQAERSERQLQVMTCSLSTSFKLKNDNKGRRQGITEDMSEQRENTPVAGKGWMERHPRWR